MIIKKIKRKKNDVHFATSKGIMTMLEAIWDDDNG
jgi:hypothetical protein